MRPRSVFVLFLLAGSSIVVCQAKERSDYQTGVLLQMESSPCGFSEKDSKTLKGQIFGTNGSHKKTQEVLCQDYILQADRIVYRIRPKDEHPVLLPVGETAQFRIHKDKIILRVPEMDRKEREYYVISMTPKAGTSENQSAKKNP